MYIPRISTPLDIHGISMDIHGYPRDIDQDGIYMGYTWNIPCIYMKSGFQMDLYYDIVCTGTYYLRNVAKRYRSVHTSTYQYKKMSKSTYAYVLNCVQSGTGQYRAVQGSTRNGTRQYRSKYNKVQGSTWRYMSVHGLHLRRAAGRGAADFGALLKSLH